MQHQIFEIVSGYGCVGISVGVPWESYSFSGAWHLTSKLILCAVMLRGRHRGLPVAIDRAILLPHESLAWAEEEDAHKRTTSFHSATVAAGQSLRRPTSRSLGEPGPRISLSRGSIHRGRDAEEMV